MKWLRFIVLFLILAPASRARTQTFPAESRPNLLLIVADDLGWGDLGVNFQNQRSATKRLHTPHLDTLAADGVNLWRHYCAAPVCAPSRASLLTGRHQGHCEIRDNQFDAALPNVPTLATMLRGGGYQTALIGKYGLQGGDFGRDDSVGGDPDRWPAYPTKRGFDDFFGYVRHRDGHQHYPAHRWLIGDSPAHREPKQLWWNGDEVSSDATGCYTTDLFTAMAKRVIDQSVNREEPFFVMVTYDTPHAALQLPPCPYPEDGVRWLGQPDRLINATGPIDSYRHPDYESPADHHAGFTDVETRFATSVRRVDDAVGDLRRHLERRGIADETMVIFTSDNGPHRESYLDDIRYTPTSFESYGPFDGIKRDCYEGGIRVPTLMAWPGQIPPQIDRRPSIQTDWMATLADAAGIDPPDPCDGVSMLPRWRSQTDAPESVIYIEYFNRTPTPSYDAFAAARRGARRDQMQVVVIDGFKGVRYRIKSDQTPFEIYDVDKDPGERNDLAGTSEAFRSLQRRMLAFADRQHRPHPNAPRPYDGAMSPQ